MSNTTELEALLKLLRQHGVTRYADGSGLALELGTLPVERAPAPTAKEEPIDSPINERFFPPTRRP